MILIDPRAGSGELLPYFGAYDVLAELSQMDYGDVMFAGNGPDGDVLVAVELKKLSDMVQSMRDQRFAGHQLPGLLENYEYVYLCVQGPHDVGPSGELMRLNGHGKGGGWTPYYTGSKAVLYSELSNFLASMELRAVSKSGEPLRVKRTNGPKETVAWLVALYKSFEKPWGSHHAHEEIYAPYTERRKKVGFIRREVSLVEKMASQIPSLDRMARYVAQRFKTPEEMCRASILEWSEVVIEVDGKNGKRKQKLGKVRAEKIVPMLRRMK